MSLTTRVATPADLDAIMAIETSVFVNDAWSAKNMAAELKNASCYYLVVCDSDSGQDALVAYAGLLAPIGSPDSDIQTIAVAPQARRRGIARDLVARMLAEAEARGAHETFLEVRVDNPGAQALYESFGFVGIAVRPKYYMPDGVDALVMRAKLPAPGARAASPGDPAASPGDPAASPGDPAASPGDPAASPGDPAASPGDPAAPTSTGDPA